MNSIEILRLIGYMLNPFYAVDRGWVAILDVLTFIFLPWYFLKQNHKDAIWRVLVFYCGFIFTQITIQIQPLLEYCFEVAGLLLIFLACFYERKRVYKHFRKA